MLGTGKNQDIGNHKDNMAKIRTMQLTFFEQFRFNGDSRLPMHMFIGPAVQRRRTEMASLAKISAAHWTATWPSYGPPLTHRNDATRGTRI